MSEFYYNCSITFGNVSQFETKADHKRMIAFLDCFRVKDFTIKLIEDEIPYYVTDIHFKDYHERKRNHFARAVLSFALYHGMGFSEF